MAKKPNESGKKKVIILVGDEFEVREPKGAFWRAVAAGLVAAAIASGFAIAVEKGAEWGGTLPPPASETTP